jgi:hypothetical protein
MAPPKIVMFDKGMAGIEIQETMKSESRQSHIERIPKGLESHHIIA